jgi:hypothetical protein
MNTEARSEFNASYNDRVGKIRAAAAIALKELDQLRSGGPMTREGFDIEVGRIAREKLHRYECDLVIHRMDDGVTRLSESPVQKSCVAIPDALPAAQFSETPSRTVGILVQQNGMNN